MDSITDWLTGSGLKISAIVFVSWLLLRFGMMVVSRLIRKSLIADNYASEREEKLREDTIISVVHAVLRILVLVITGMLILSELNLDIGPLIAGAGVAGIAVGFGAQSLIKDFVSGVFVVMENQYRVGDIVELDGVGGTVKKISMRTTVLRDLDGNVHHIPNGSVTHATNKTMEFSKVNLDIGVSYEDDIDKVEKVINQVGADLAADEEWKELLLENPKFLRVNDFGDSSVEVKIVAKTQPTMQWKVTGELRRRLKKAFDKEGIEIPFPQRVVHDGKKSKI